MKRTTPWAALLVLLLARPLSAQIQETSEFRWSERLPAGAWLRVHTVQGDVRVLPADGSEATVEARTTRAAMRFEVLRDGEDVVICATWDDDDECDVDGIESRGRRSGRSPAADFTIRLPSSARLRAATGNGDVEASAAAAEIVAHSGNGDLTISGTAGKVRAHTGNGVVLVEDARGPVEAHTGNGRILVNTAAGPVQAHTGNGDIEVRLSTLPDPEPMEFRTGNGDIDVVLPEDFAGELLATVGSGDIESDFPLNVRGRISRRHLEGTIGAGGPRVTFSSGSGDIRLRRGR